MSAAASSDDRDDVALSPRDAAQVASLDLVRAGLVAEAQLWAARIDELSALAARADRAGKQTRRTLALELAGSWQIGQLTAERWVGEADRFADALPLTLSMMRSGALLVHQAKVLLHKTLPCTPEVASAVEGEVLPDGAGLCPADLGRQVDRVRLRIESELADPADAERQEAEKVASRRTWSRPTEDGMAVAGALITPEQGVAWASGMDALERRERLADRAAGIDRTAEQRRADLFAALPSMVLNGMAQDDRWRRAAGLPTGGRAAAAPGEQAPFDQPPSEQPPSDQPPTDQPPTDQPPSDQPPSDQPPSDPRLFAPQAPVPPPWTFHPEQIAAQVVLNVHVPVSTVLDLSREPGTLDRHGPVSAEHVRLLRPKSFRRILVDAISGRPIAVDDHTVPAADTEAARREQVQQMLRPAVIADTDEPQHDPSARLARLIDLRDVRCCGPGCSSSRCDRDHLQPHPEGPTSASNLGLASPRCHSAKHHGWTLLRHPDGSVTWHSPLHRSYDRPGPWNPPPKIDLWAEPPPPRPRPATRTPEDDTGSTLLERLRPTTPEAPTPPRQNGWPDPPF